MTFFLSNERSRRNLNKDNSDCSNTEGKHVKKNKEKPEMGSKPTSKPKPFSISCLAIVVLTILIITVLLRPKPEEDYPQWLPEKQSKRVFSKPIQIPRWYEVLSKDFKDKKLKIGLVNIDIGTKLQLHKAGATMEVKFQSVSKDNLVWKDLFPEWIDEEKPEEQKCPDIPMPRFEDYEGLNVVVAKVPCTEESEKRGYMDVFRLQLNLVVANLLVRSSRMSYYNDDEDGDFYAVFFGSCGPMAELFRCEDLLWHEENTWIYKPDLRRLKHKVMMPVGTCQLPRPFAQPGQEEWKRYAFQETFREHQEAYVTVLHSSEDYVCGAIVLGQSIVQSKTEKDLILLADNSITRKSLQALKLAGWKIKKIERIRSANAEKNAYNEYNYSKLRIWQLTEYDKVMFLDSDLLVLRNLDEFFFYPQLTAVGNCRHLFNSGVLLLEPSKCRFEDLMEKTHSIVSYNGGDQGFLNEIFKWWHRLPRKVNFLKDFYNVSVGPEHEYPEDTYALHYLGVKPWKCYQDYDCNWDIEDSQRFASDSAHKKWWEIYESMPKELRPFCALTREMEETLIKNRERAKKGNFSDGHWKIKVKDPRRRLI